MQDFSDFEVIVVSDASRGTDEKKRSAKKIVSLAQKECKKYRKENSLAPVKIRFIEHHQNRGCVEVRRTLVYESKGSWIAMLDSDDELMEHALKKCMKQPLKLLQILFTELLKKIPKKKNATLFSMEQSRVKTSFPAGLRGSSAETYAASS